MPTYAPINAMSVVTGSGNLAPVTAIPVVIITDGSVPVGPATARPVIEVTAAYPRAPVQPVPIVYAAGSPAVAKLDPIPVFVVASGAEVTGWPNAASTGPQVGTVFTTQSGVVNTTSDGQTIQNLNLTGSIHVKHNNVTIRDCNINMDSFYGIDTDGVAHTNLTVLRCKLFSSVLGPNSGIDFNQISGTEISYCDISGRENGIYIGSSCNIHDNYIHDLGGSGPDPHVDGIQNAGNSNVIIQHNSILATDTSCIIMQNEDSSFSNCTINNNRLVGAPAVAHGILCQAKDDHPANTCSNITITNNRVDGADFKVFLHNVNGYTFTGNVVDSTGLPFAIDDGGGNTPSGGGGGSVATLTYQAAGTQNASGTAHSVTLTVASAAGVERLVAIGTITSTNPTAVTISAVTIDGQGATQVGPYSKQLASDGAGQMVSFWRAAGTASTSVTVAFTTSVSCFCAQVGLWNLQNGGTAFDTAADGGQAPTMDPVLDVDTVANGAVVAVVAGYGNPTKTTTWTGVTENFDGNTIFTDDWFSGGAVSSVAAATPRAVAADLPTFGSTRVVAGLAVSFNHT